MVAVLFKPQYFVFFGDLQCFCVSSMKHLPRQLYGLVKDTPQACLTPYSAVVYKVIIYVFIVSMSAFLCMMWNSSNVV